MSGRDLFDYRPEWFAEEEDEAGSDVDAGDGSDGWDLEKMRQETREAEEREEELRMEQLRQGFENVEVHD
jgi:hypothetical protein